ncbi:MAG TPA: class I SAM-dependent methyltransferase [Acidimicrobiia bacterium]
MPTDNPMPRMYDDLAVWFPLITPVEDYREESAFIAGLFGRAQIPVLEVLELGSGGGHVASHLSDRFAMTLVDISPQMLAVSQQLNPGCNHIEGDMRDVRLGRQFDAVLIHDAVMYMTSEDDLMAAMATAFAHCRPGGITIIAPDFTLESYEPTASHEGTDDASGRGVRFLEWVWDPDPSDTQVRVDYVYALRDETGQVEVVHDPHQVGLFPRATWLSLLESAGFSADSVIDPDDREIFLGLRLR